MPNKLKGRQACHTASKLLCSVLLALTAASHSGDLELPIGGSHYCPYICEGAEPTGYSGYMVELAKASGKLQGLDITAKLAPFSRITRQTKSGDVAGIFLLGQFRDRSEYIITNIQVDFQPCFFVHKNNTWEYNGLHSLEDVTVGLIQSYGYPDTIMDHLAAHNSSGKAAEFVTSEKAQIQNVKKVIAGRVDALYDDRLVIHWVAQNEGLNSDIREAGCPAADIVKGNLVITKTYPDAENVVSKLNKGFEEFRKSENFLKLKRKYYLN